MPGWNQSLCKVITCATLLLSLASCSGGGSSGGGTTAPPPAGSVTVTGTVSGTIIKVLRADTGAVIRTADTAPLINPPFPFTLSSIPVGIPIKAFFFSAGETFPLYVGNPPTNVFTMKMAGAIDLGVVTMDGGRATPQFQPPNVTLGAEDLSPLPPGIEPPPATLTVPTPDPGTGSVIVEHLAVENFTIGGQGQQHLHIRVDGSATTYHFFNGSTNKVLDDDGTPTPDVVEWHSTTSFWLKELSTGSHQVTVKLATASENEFVNPEANPTDVTVIINPPPPAPPTLNITSPSQNVSLPSGPVDVSFTVDNFTIGDEGETHLHIYLDTEIEKHFFNGTTNQVLDNDNGNGQPVANMTWLSTASFRITGLSSGPHTIRLKLSDALGNNLQNPEARPPDRIFNIEAPPGPPTVIISSPAQGATLPAGPVLVTFNIQNSPVPPSDAQPRMHFYIDSDTTPYKFYDGPGIGEEGSSSGVRYNSIHTHFVHWKSASSFAISGLPSGSHQVRLVLTDANDIELPNPEATKTRTFTISTPLPGDLELQPVITGLNFPVGLTRAPDGRIFYNERLTGAIRIISPGWQLNATACVQIPVSVGPEQGLLGLTLDPSFAQNHFVYVYYTASGPVPVNRVVRYTEVSGLCMNPTAIIDAIPASDFHNGGIIQFGPDGMLYVFAGNAENSDNSPDLTSLAGKILRVKPDGTAPADNPFISDPNANAKKVFSYGHRNGFGFTFHGHTGDLWETENGPDVNDEINHIIAGGNYGWRTLNQGEDNSDRSGILNNPCCVDPILVLTNPTIAPTGIISIPENSTVYPAAYQNNLLFVDFNGGKIRRVVLSGADLTQLGSQSIAYNGGNGGLISLMLGADGFVYVTNTGAFPSFSDAKIFRVVPQ